MAESLKIEIEADDRDKVHSILDHVLKEINEGPKYTNDLIEANCSTENLSWLIIKDGPFKGKYRWTRLGKF